MSDLLTPEEMEAWGVELDSTLTPDGTWIFGGMRKARTLRAYAEVVEAIAGGDPRMTVWSDVCIYCGGSPHAPDCLYLRARQLRGQA